MFDYKCYPERYTLNAVPEAPEPPVYFDAIVSDVWKSIGTNLSQRYGSDVDSAIIALESILVVDDIVSYAQFLSPSALTDSQNQPTYYANLYASIARKICILRHTILRDNNSAHNCTEVEDAQLYPIDVCMYMMRSNRFASAQSCRERSKNQRNRKCIIKSDSNPAQDLELKLRNYCGRHDFFESTLLAPLPSLYDVKDGQET